MNITPKDTGTASSSPSSLDASGALGDFGDLAIPADPAQASRAVRLPLVELGALGAGFSSVATQAQAIAAQAAATGSGATLLAVTDSAGNPLSTSVLNAAKDGSGLIGSYSGTNGLAQARFHEVSAGTTGGIVFDPSMALMAVAVMALSRKLDGLQRSVDKLQRYMEVKDMAEVRGALKTLMSDAKNYPLKYDDELFVQGAHGTAKTTRRVAEKRIYQLQGLIDGEAKSLRRLHTRGNVADLAESIESHLQEYLLALNAYNYATFVMVMLQGDFDEAYLASVRDEMREHDLDYRTLYTDCYDTIENASKSAADDKLVGGLAKATGGLSRLVAKTPVGDRTSIDEALASASVNLDLSNSKSHLDVMERLRVAKDTNVDAYLKSLDQLQAVNTGAVAFFVDRKALYVLPVEAAA